MPKLAQNPETGETLALVGGQWQPAKIAQNDKGERLVLGDNGWEPMPGPKRSTGVRATRAAAMGAKGFTDSLAETIAAPADLLGRGMRAVGIPYPGQNGDVANMLKRGIAAAGGVLAAPVNAGLEAAGVDLGPNKAETTGEKFAYGAGRGAADAASVAVPAAMVGRAAQAGSVTQRVAQSLAAQPVTQAVSGAVGGGVGEATDNPLLGMAASLATPAIASGVRNIVSPVGMQLTPEEARRAAIAAREGIQLTPGQQTGSRPLQAVESSLAQLPISGSRQNALYDAQRQGFNRAALTRAGVTGDRVSPDVIDGAFNQLGQQFDNLANRTTLRVDPAFANDVNRVATEYGRRLDTNVAGVFQSYLDDLAPLINAARTPGANPQIDGRTYQNIHSDLARAARESRANPALQRAIGGLQDALDGVMQRTAPPDVARAWGETRGQYRNLLAIDQAAANGTAADRAAGNLSFGAFRQAVKGQDPRGAGRGRGDMAELSQLADFLAQKIPNSGTPERSAAMRMVQGGGMFGGVGGTAAMSGADPMMAAASGVTAVALPPLVQAFINSPAGRRYLTNNAMTGVGPQYNRNLAAALLGAQSKDALLAPSN